eukprot:TRINITY_DN5652_c0_g1_i1.p1 TRINITY_DN5652_c0_g1~~TRINITY_DN5652_c0_g1_i1.p1  ORF type:complete len:582 (-),score=136.37 TRINITY_DN5652_c0_g1_i1:504-2249(-)
MEEQNLSESQEWQECYDAYDESYVIEPPTLEELGVEIQPFDAEKVLQPHEQEQFEEKLGLFLARPEYSDDLDESELSYENMNAAELLEQEETADYGAESQATVNESRSRRSSVIDAPIYSRRLSTADATAFARRLSKRITKDQVEVLLSHFESMIDSLDDLEETPSDDQSAFQLPPPPTLPPPPPFFNVPASSLHAHAPPPTKPPPPPPISSLPPAPPPPRPPQRPPRTLPTSIQEEEVEYVEEEVIQPPSKSLPAVPDTLQKCISFLAENALKLAGIFRVPPASSDLENLKSMCKSDSNWDFPADTDPHAVASFMKQYFRSMPEPVLTFDLYDCFMAAEGIPDKSARINCLAYLMTTIRPAYLTQVFALFSFLKKVADHSEFNKMGAKNLATVFAPNILRPREQTMEQMSQDVQKLPIVIEMIINEFQTVFEPYLPRTVTVKKPVEVAPRLPQPPARQGPIPTSTSNEPVPLPSQLSSRYRGLNLSVDTAVPIATGHSTAGIPPPPSPGRPLPVVPNRAPLSAPAHKTFSPTGLSATFSASASTPLEGSHSGSQRFQPLPAGTTPSGPPPPLPPRSRGNH